MGACKTFNLILPYDTYRKLRKIAMDKEWPIAELVRQGIDLVLNKECKLSEDDTDGWF